MPPSPGQPAGGNPTTVSAPIITTGSAPASQFAVNSNFVSNLISSKAGAPTTPTVTTPTTVPNTANPTDPNAPNTPININNYSDPYTQELDKIAATSDQATKNLISTIQAQRATQASTINDNADRLKAGLMSLGVETGNVNFTPDLVYGHIQQAENNRVTQLQDLDQKENTAILNAQTAAQNKDFTTLKEKVAYIKSVQAQRNSILTTAYTQANDEAKLGAIEASQIYDQFQKLPNDQAKVSFVAGVAQKYGISPISITTALNALQTKNAKAAGKATATGGAFKTSQNIARVLPQMDAEVKASGSTDGYIDPNKWVAARDSWEAAGGSAASFKSNFLQYLNPASYKIAGYKVPKDTSGSGQNLGTAGIGGQ